MIELSGPSSADSPLKKYFENNLKVAEARGKLYCHVLTDVHHLDDWRDEQIGPKKGPFEHVHTRQTILIYQSYGGMTGRPSPNASPSKRKSNEYVLVMGMTAWEYCWNERPNILSRVYIQYVDTTGLYKPRKCQGTMTRNVVATYLRYCREVLQVLYAHLYASAKPSLLFPGSELLPRKKSLDSLKLINWWLALVQYTRSENTTVPCFLSASSRQPVVGFVHFPAEESMPNVAQSIRNHLNTLNRTGKGQWQFALPYSDLEEEQTHIPLFEDDPKWRHYEAVYEYDEEKPSKRQRRENNRHTVGEFFQTLTYRSEFRQEPSAFIVIKFPENTEVAPYTPYITMKKNEIAAFACKLLKTLFFETEIDALKSSMRTWSWLKLMGATPFEVQTDAENHPTDYRFTETTNCLPRSESTIPSTFSATQNDVQSLVKKKPAKGSL